MLATRVTREAIASSIFATPKTALILQFAPHTVLANRPTTARVPMAGLAWLAKFLFALILMLLIHVCATIKTARAFLPIHAHVISITLAINAKFQFATRYLATLAKFATTATARALETTPVFAIIITLALNASIQCAIR